MVLVVHVDARVKKLLSKYFLFGNKVFFSLNALLLFPDEYLLALASEEITLGFTRGCSSTSLFAARLHDSDF